LSESIDKPPVVYYIGDEVKLRMSFTHDDQIVAVEVVYAHEEERTHTLCLSGNPTLDDGSPTVGRAKRSTVELSAVWDAGHEPGRYEVVRAVYYNFAGHAGISFDLGGIHNVEWPVLELDIEGLTFEITEVTQVLEDADELET
jgi:hypothetical protein